MMKKNLNLCTDPWLPVRLSSGSCMQVSLEEFFSTAHEISDLILAAHERISIMRLLICIAQRAIDGPSDREEWDECKDEIGPKAVEYLQKWRHAFNLIGENGAFLQPKEVSALKDEDWGDLCKLSISSSVGNNPTLFDNGAGSERFVSLEQLAVDLLTFQNFAPSGTIGVTLWAGQLTGAKSPDSAPAGPCVPSSAIHLFICGNSMLETLWYNLCTCEEFSMYRKGMGKPIWELMPFGMDDVVAIENATYTYFGRLVPLSRVVKVATSADKCLISRGITYPVYGDDKTLLYYESTMSVVLDGDKSRRIVGADIDRAMWRNLPALLHRFSSGYKSFSSLYEQELPSHYGVWIGSLVLDKAKILGAMEDYYEHLNRECVGVAADKRQASLMKMADVGGALLKSAIMSYYAHFNSPFDNKKTVFTYAENNFWSKLTSHKAIYIKCLASSEEDMESYKTGRLIWANAICDAASATFNLLVSRNNVRQLAAWARARCFLPTSKKLMDENDK